MLTDLDIALLLQQQYDGVQGVFDFNSTIAGVSLAVKIYDDQVVLIFEGTHDKIDVEHDFEADMIYPVQLLGKWGVHAGFWQGLPEAIDVIYTMILLDKPLIVTGHSLGAGRVNLAVAYLMMKGMTTTNITRIKFGAPRSNNQALEDAIRNSICRSYFNYGGFLRHDPVVDVPRRILPLFPYFVDEPKIIINEAPPPADEWGDFLGWHHMRPNYINGLAKRERIENGQTLN